MTKQQRPTSPAVRSGTRKERKLLARQIWSDKPGLDVVHKDAAGIDVGSKEHYAAVPPNRDPQPVRCFGCFTSDLHRMADWLIQCGVKTVVLQSTGVYWIPVYDVLEQRGLEVWLVNARETKNLPGRKSDVQESQWLLKLHTYGLLRRSFRPLRANIAETLSPALITEQGENGNQREYESEAQWIRRGGCGLARRGTERG
jgi:transposase